MELELKVGATLILESPDGVRTYTVAKICMSSGVDPDFTTTTPHAGRVTLTLRAEEPRSGTWAQYTEEAATLVVGSGEPIEIRDPA